MADERPQHDPHATDSHARWRFLRDVAVFQFKLALDNLRDFALVPVSLIAAAIDLAFKGEHEGALFYMVLRWGLHSEKIIDLYSVIERGDGPGHDFTVDAAIARLESVILREYEKGGTAAGVKAAVDHAIDQIRRESKVGRGKARGALARAADNIRPKLDTKPDSGDVPPAS
jgi:hypothetical protein